MPLAELETKNQVERMPITYDISKDGLFLEGKKEGIILTAKELLKRGISIQEVHDITSLPKEELTKIARKLKRDK